MRIDIAVSSDNKELAIKLFGGFELRNTSGESLLPKGKKEIALCALLASAKGQHRTREWLKQMLWSDRSEAQASASLRRALSNIRSALATSRHCLVTDTHHVWWNPDLVHIDWLPSQDTQGIESEDQFLAGLATPDPRLKQWLTEYRNTLFEKKRHPTNHTTSNIPPHQSAASTTEAFGTGTTRQTIDLYAVEANNTSHEALAASELLVHTLVENVAGLGVGHIRDLSWQTFTEGYPADNNPGALCLRIFVTTAPGKVHVSMRAIAHATFEVVFSAAESISTSSRSNIDRQVFTVVQKFVNFLIGYNLRLEAQGSFKHLAAIEASVVVKGLFIPGSINISQLEEKINAAIALDPLPIYHTMRATLSLMRYGERLSGTDPIREQINDELHHALTAGTDNVVLMAWTGHAVGYFLKDRPFSLTLTKRAVEMAPNNWICWMFRSTTLAYANRGKESQLAIRTALQLPIPLIFRPFALSNAAQAECLAGDMEAAERCAVEAMHFNRQFHATARTLLTVYCCTKRCTQSVALIDQIKRRETDFCTEVVTSDQYPIPSSDIKSMLVTGLNRLGV